MKKQKKQTGQLIYGIHPVIEVLRAKRRKVLSIYTVKPHPKKFDLIERLLPSYPVAMQYVSRDVLDRMAQTTDHQSVVAWVQDFPMRKKPFDSVKSPFILLLDSIQDPRNLGAILRSAYCTGVTGVMITTKRAAPLNAVALKSSAGLAEHLEIMQVSSAQQALSELDSRYGVFLAALGGKDATTQKYPTPLCLVIGNEAIGISKSLFKYGTVVTLPQKESTISYNASVAAGILLFMISSQNKLV